MTSYIKEDDMISLDASVTGKLALISVRKHHVKFKKVLSLLRHIFKLILPIPVVPCQRMALFLHPSNLLSLADQLTGTLFGYKRGFVRFSVQKDPSAQPILLLELPTTTNMLMKEMATGLVRIALECNKSNKGIKLYDEAVWTAYCNGTQTGFATKNVCSELDRKILSNIEAISMGVGVLPMDKRSSDGELMYLRARFERVIGSKNAEAFYMINPDRPDAPELSIFLLRV